MGTLGSTLALLAFGALAVYCIPTDSLHIQNTLETTTTTAIAAIPVRGVTVRVDGRDVVLTGRVTTESERQQAGLLTLALPGVRSVDNRIEVVAAAPTIAPSVPQVQAQLQQILLDRTIEFETARAVLTPASDTVLEEIRAVLAQAPQLSVRIEGHTDNVGDPATNRSLSLARAQAVVDWLAERGIPRQRLVADGFGPDRPVADNNTVEGRARNRRVNITAR